MVGCRYDLRRRRAATVRDIVASKATELPILKKESRQLTMKGTKMELKETFHPGLTFGLFRQLFSGPSILSNTSYLRDSEERLTGDLDRA